MAKSLLLPTRPPGTSRLLQNADVEVFQKSLDTAGTIPPLAKWEEIAHEIDLTLEELGKGGDPAELAKQLQEKTEGLAG